MNKRIQLVFLFLTATLAPPVAAALDMNSPHWFGIGAGASVGKKTVPVGVFTAGRLWTDAFGTGGMVVYPLEGVEDGEVQVTAAATFDAFFHQGRSHLAALVGASDIEGNDELRFTTGLRFDWNVPLSGNLVLMPSASPLWVASQPSPFRAVLHGELQFRY
jgi:hypothetical protein